ncbi:hypothetical protein EJ07DRAFT_159410 [Lizonia empirigonia]|nr:hypothetical protein EJ07DRAFT_159410 [Lizonia empirigonia]
MSTRSTPPSTPRDTIQPKHMTPAKTAALRAIKVSWAIKHIADMFLTDEAKKKMQQHPVPNDDFFEEATLALFRQLAEKTKDKKEEVQAKLKTRWSARLHARKDGGTEALRGGGDATEMNAYLRVDLREFISHFSPEEQRKSEDGKQVDAETSNGTVSRPSKLSALVDKTAATHTGSTPAPREAEALSSRSGVRKVTSEEAVATIKSNWDIELLTDIMPQHSYPHRIKEYPHTWSTDLLKELWRLSKLTAGRQDEVHAELQKAFHGEKTYTSTTAVAQLATIYERFSKEQTAQGHTIEDEPVQIIRHALTLLQLQLLAADRALRSAELDVEAAQDRRTRVFTALREGPGEVAGVDAEVVRRRAVVEERYGDVYRLRLQVAELVGVEEFYGGGGGEGGDGGEKGEDGGDEYV